MGLDPKFPTQCEFSYKFGFAMLRIAVAVLATAVPAAAMIFHPSNPDSS